MGLTNLWPPVWCSRDQSSFWNTPTSLTKKQKEKEKKKKHKHEHKQKYKEKQVSLFCKELAELIVFIFIRRSWRTSGYPTRQHRGPSMRQTRTTTPRTSSIIPPRWPRTTTLRIVYDLTTPTLQWTLMQSFLR